MLSNPNSTFMRFFCLEICYRFTSLKLMTNLTLLSLYIYNNCTTKLSFEDYFTYNFEVRNLVYVNQLFEIHSVILKYKSFDKFKTTA